MFLKQDKIRYKTVWAIMYTCI